MQVRILCGVPGSGKTTLARTLETDYVCSANDFFTPDGVYRFDASLLPQAHAACLKKFIQVCRNAENQYILDDFNVVVDNTNTTVVEIAPYAAIAQAYGHELEVIIIHCDPVVAHARNVHGVPLAAVIAMDGRLRSMALPPWWSQRVIEQDQ